MNHRTASFSNHGIAFLKGRIGDDLVVIASMDLDGFGSSRERLAHSGAVRAWVEKGVLPFEATLPSAS